MKEALETQEVPEGMASEMAEPVKKKRVTVADLQEKLQTLDTFLDEAIIPAINQLEVRMEESEKRTAKHNDTLLSDVKIRLDTLETATGSLADMLRSYRMAKPPEEEITEPELEFAKPPERPPTSPPTAGDIEMVAGVCLTMSDVLVICRALKEMSDLPDQEKIRILNIACRAAGVDDTQGLRIRAGITTQAA